MRTLIVCGIVSLDGSCLEPRDDVMVTPMDAAFDAGNAERRRTAGTVLTGPLSCDPFKGYRPRVADAPKVPPEDRETSRRTIAIAEVVVSDSMSPDPARSRHATAEFVPRTDALARIAPRSVGRGQTSRPPATARPGTICSGMTWSPDFTCWPALCDPAPGSVGRGSGTRFAAMVATVDREGGSVIPARR